MPNSTATPGTNTCHPPLAAPGVARAQALPGKPNNSPEAFAAFNSSEMAKWALNVKPPGAKVD